MKRARRSINEAVAIYASGTRASAGFSSQGETVSDPGEITSVSSAPMMPPPGGCEILPAVMDALPAILTAILFRKKLTQFGEKVQQLGLTCRAGS